MQDTIYVLPLQNMYKKKKKTTKHPHNISTLHNTPIIHAHFIVCKLNIFQVHLIPSLNKIFVNNDDHLSSEKQTADLK